MFDILFQRFFTGALCSCMSLKIFRGGRFLRLLAGFEALEQRQKSLPAHAGAPGSVPTGGPLVSPSSMGLLGVELADRRGDLLKPCPLESIRVLRALSVRDGAQFKRGLALRRPEALVSTDRCRGAIKGVTATPCCVSAWRLANQSLARSVALSGFGRRSLSGCFGEFRYVSCASRDYRIMDLKNSFFNAGFFKTRKFMRMNVRAVVVGATLKPGEIADEYQIRSSP